MSESTIRQAIFTILKAIPDIGKTYDYDRNNADWGEFIKLFQAPSGRILGWEISRAGVQAEKLSVIEESSDHVFIIRGYMGVKDADKTELLFNAKIEAVRAAFRGNNDLGGVCTDAGPVSAQIDVRTFGSVLCHHAELRLPVNEILT